MSDVREILIVCDKVVYWLQEKLLNIDSHVFLILLQLPTELAVIMFVIVVSLFVYRYNLSYFKHIWKFI